MDTMKQTAAPDSYVYGVDLTPLMYSALETAVRTGAIFPGRRRNPRVDARVFHQATVKALVNKGFLTLSVGPDGGPMARPTPSGVALDAQIKAVR